MISMRDFRKENLLSNQRIYFIRETYKLAGQSIKEGNHPFAAIAVSEGEVVASALNQVVLQNDSTKHAELNLASHLSQNFTRQEIARMIVYSSTEPCPMCASALFWMGCRNIVYGCSTEALGRHTTKSLSVSIRQSLASVSQVMNIEGPILEDEGEVLHRNFWNTFGGKS
jgi:tRNA(Arg) A34 adenosine deaminase TadA